MKTLVIHGISANKKIQAIKGYRAITGKGLKEAKDVIDRVAVGIPVEIVVSGEDATVPVTQYGQLVEQSLKHLLEEHSLLYHFKDPRSMLTTWMIWVRERGRDGEGDGQVWLEAAWENDMTYENPSGWEAEIDRVRKLCEGPYEMRIQKVHVPGVLELFATPEVEAETDEIRRV
jgi:hypothetical protein